MYQFTVKKKKKKQTRTEQKLYMPSIGRRLKIQKPSQRIPIKTRTFPSSYTSMSQRGFPKTLGDGGSRRHAETQSCN